MPEFLAYVRHSKSTFALSICKNFVWGKKAFELKKEKKCY